MKWLLGLAIVLLAGCAAPVSSNRPVAASREAERASFAEPPRDRPGLGTRWGETRQSLVTATNFERARRDPVATAAVYYDDERGIRALAETANLARAVPIITEPTASLVTLELRDEYHRLLPGLNAGERWFVIGREGSRYSIIVRNRTEFRLEVVLSVDGLDVIDGRAASWRKRGYVLDPYRRLIVEGFRQSADAVAAFRFSPVRESYANEKYHDTRNVGVIGLALFAERGREPLPDKEIRRRLRADPFPGRFATPP